MKSLQSTTHIIHLTYHVTNEKRTSVQKLHHAPLLVQRGFQLNTQGAYPYLSRGVRRLHGCDEVPESDSARWGQEKPSPFFRFISRWARHAKGEMHGFAFLSSLLISAENREGYSQRAVCFSLFFSPGIPLKREDRSLQGSPAKETYSLFTFRCFSLCSLFLVGLFSPRNKESSLEPCNVRWFSVNTLIYTITNTQPFSFNSKWMTLWEKKRVVSVVMKRDIWNAHYKVYVFFLQSMHHQNSICIYSKEKRPVFSCWPVLCRFGAVSTGLICFHFD